METLILVILLAILIGEVTTIVIKAPILRITLGNLGDFWIRAPQNTALAVLKHKKLDKMIFAISENKLNKITDEVKEKFDKKEERYISISDIKKGGLHYIGPSFLGFEVYEWFETKEDEKDGINSLHSIDLAEQVIKYLPEEPKKQKDGEKIIPIEKSEFDAIYGVPSFKSADNIEIRTSLAIFFVVRDPEKALFSVRYRKKAIQEQIFPLWRDVLGKFSFFAYGESESSSQKNPDIKTEAGNALKEIFGLEVKGKSVRGTEDIATKLFEEEWGMWVRDITVGELEAADPEIEEALSAQMIARTKALAEIEEAIGIEKAFIHKGAGERIYFEDVITGLAGSDEKARKEAREDLVKLKNFEAMKEIPPGGRAFFQWPQISSSSDGLSDLLKNLDIKNLTAILQAIKK